MCFETSNEIQMKCVRSELRKIDPDLESRRDHRILFEEEMVFGEQATSNAEHDWDVTTRVLPMQTRMPPLLLLLLMLLLLLLFESGKLLAISHTACSELFYKQTNERASSQPARGAIRQEAQNLSRGRTLLFA